MDPTRGAKALLTLCGLFFFVTPAFAGTSDLDVDSIPDHEDPEVVVSVNVSLPAGEYTFHNLTIANGSVLTLLGDPNSTNDFKGVKIIADNITIESASAISANGTGYRSFGNSPGAGGGYAGGYGYGGRGGDWQYGADIVHGGDTYGSAFMPRELGSGDGTYAGGGGAVWLDVSGTLENNGTISANGVPQQASGGSIYVQTSVIEGSGMFTANGTGCSWYYPYSGAGGGGRIAVYYDESGFTGAAEALRGGIGTNSSCQGKATGQDGTVAFIDTTHNDLYLKERFLFQASDYSYEFDRIVLSDGASVSSEPGVTITAQDVILSGTSTFDTAGVSSFIAHSLVIDNGSTFTSAEGQSLTLSSLTVRNKGTAQLGKGETLNVSTITLENGSQITATPMRVLHLEVSDINIDETSVISATGAGYPGRQGPGYNTSGAGASHGGLGEAGTPSPVYGSETAPVDFGSGGSSDAYGGGSLRMIVSGVLENNGVISADATPVKNGASGGSLYVTTNKLSGSGSFTALGGNSREYYSTDVGAGGGGRIAVYYKDSDFVGTTSAKGGDRYLGGAIQQFYYAQDGTVVFEKEEPKGISNILFLPGIQASRLYTKDENGEEEKLWEPGGNNDVFRLTLNNDGTSVEEVYTKDVIEEKLDVAVGGNIYKGFLEYLNNIDGPFTGPIIQTFPYDWRHDVFDIVESGTKVGNGLIKKPIDEIVFLATTSPTKKVTIVAHSNGGLLAKAIMLKLTEEGRGNLIDKIIFIATPHLGTPKGIAALLHGYDQRLLRGFLAEDEVVRNVMKNMQGAYGLLPSESYVASLAEPMISFDDSATTKLYRDAYGFTISSVDEYIRFLKGLEGREDAGDDVYKPSIANSIMLDRALQEHRTKLDTWTAPTGVEVYNIVGTGLPTPKLIEYREFMQTQCNADRSVCITMAKIEPRLYQSSYGDRTVISKSAKALESNELFIDLSLVEDYDHGNITESETIQTLTGRILHGSSTDDLAYVTSTEPTFNEIDLDVLELHSPAHMYVRDNEGNVTGKIEGDEIPREEIYGSSYFEFGGGKYLLVPSDLAYSIVIEGDGDGLYTHIASTLTGDTQAELHAFTATVTPEMVATYVKTENGFSIISIDEDSDGEIDNEMTLEGEILNKNVTYEDLIVAIKSAGLPQQHEKHVLEKIGYAKQLLELRTEKTQNEHLEEITLSALQKSFEQFRKHGLLTNVQYEEVVIIIQKLIEQ